MVAGRRVDNFHDAGSWWEIADLGTKFPVRVVDLTEGIWNTWE